MFRFIFSCIKLFEGNPSFVGYSPNSGSNVTSVYGRTSTFQSMLVSLMVMYTFTCVLRGSWGTFSKKPFSSAPSTQRLTE